MNLGDRMKKIIVIGAGISGLSAGIYGLLNGYDVEIYEKNHEAGGFLTSWKRDNMIIDGCLHWLWGTKEGTGLNNVWKTVGGLDNVDIYNPNSFYEVHYEGRSVAFYRDVEKLRESLLSVSDNDDSEIEAFVNAIKGVGLMENPSEAPYELADPVTLKPKMSALKKAGRYLKMTIEELAERFNSKVIKFALLNSPIDKRFSVYYFLQTLGNFVFDNASLPKGGSHKLRDRMVDKFISLGGKICYNSNTAEVIIEDNTAKGIRLVNGNEIYFDYVISTSDIHHTFDVLLKNKYNRAPYDMMDNDKKMYPTYSFLIASFKTKHIFRDSEISQVYNVDEYSLFNKKYNSICFRQYSYDSEYLNDEYTPIQVLLYTNEDDYDYLKSLSKDEYKKFKNEASRIFKEKLESIFESEFELIDVLTPLTYTRYTNAYKGGFMSYCLLPKISQYVRSPLVEGLNNFILANQWLVLPGGTPVAVTSGKFAIQHILNLDGLDYNIDK